MAAVVVLISAGVATAVSSSPNGLQYSKTADMEDAASLSQQNIEGSFYVSLPGSASDVTSVNFFIDDAMGTGEVSNSTEEAPFVTKVPVLGTGAHSLLAVIRDSNGKTHDLFARFTVIQTITPKPEANPTATAPASTQAEDGSTAVDRANDDVSDVTIDGPTIYVAADGSDNNDGTSATSAKQTIAAAISAANAGDTVLVGPGTYNGNLIIDNGGSDGEFITLRSSTEHGAKINGNGDTSEQSAVEINSPYVRIQGFEITGEQGVRNGVLINADNVEIIGNEIHTICQFLTGGTSWQGGAGVDIAKAETENLLIDGNIIHDIGAPGSTEQLVHGMYLSSHVTNGRVTNNVIYRVEDFGVHPYDESEASGWQVINNTVVDTGRGILQAPGGITRNNIVFDTRGTQYDIRGDGNVVSDNIGGGSGAESTDGVTEADPMFTNPSSNEYTLQSGSPAIGIGTTTDAPAKDIKGKSRPSSGIDLGAYQH